MNPGNITLSDFAALFMDSDPKMTVNVHSLNESGLLTCRIEDFYENRFKGDIIRARISDVFNGIDDRGKPNGELDIYLYPHKPVKI